MDGYVITPTAEEALDAFGREGVRFVAAFDGGQGFIAFDGPIPVEHGMILECLAEAGIGPKVKRYPFGGDGFALFTSSAFRALDPKVVKESSNVGADLILATVNDVVDGAIWIEQVSSYRDVRELVDA